MNVERVGEERKIAVALYREECEARGPVFIDNK